MARCLDMILVVDVEATNYGPTPEDKADSEIIAISVAVYDPFTRNTVDSETMVVRPVRATISPQIHTSVTPLRMQLEGIPFQQACALLRQRYGSHRRLWASYGDYDRIKFEQQCAVQGVPYPFSMTHLNVRSLASLKLGLKKELFLEQACDRFGLTFYGEWFNSLHKVMMTAKLLPYVLPFPYLDRSQKPIVIIPEAQHAE